MFLHEIERLHCIVSRFSSLSVAASVPAAAELASTICKSRIRYPFVYCMYRERII